MQISPLLEAQAELTRNSPHDCPVVLSTRVRLARNLADMPFPGWAKMAQREEVLSHCSAAIKATSEMSASTDYEISSLKDIEKQILVERHLISRELSTGEGNAGVIISPRQDCSIMINEEDHLRIQFLSSGFNFKQVWKSISKLDTELESRLDFAFSPDLGYLTACPTNVGTGLRASAMMHLPALVIANQMEKVVRAVNQLGLAVRGLFGEGSDASGSIFQISNQQTLGESEEQIIKRLTNVLNSVIEQEINTREKILEKDPIKLFDKIGRAYGALKHSHLINSAEAMNLLSLLRLAIDLKILDEKERPLIDRLFIECQPGHVQYAMKDNVEAGKRDWYRAKHLREQFSELSLLNFNNATCEGT